MCESPIHPFWVYKTEDSKLVSYMSTDFVACRQNLPKAYSLNGALYFAKSTWLVKSGSLVTADTFAFHMPKSNSYDIDDKDDWIVAETLLKYRLSRGAS